MEETAPIRRIPPTITRPTSAAMTPPDSQTGAPSATEAERETVFAWFMLPLPKLRFEARRVIKTRANSLSVVRFDCNDYSVPTEYAHREVTAIERAIAQESGSLAQLLAPRMRIVLIIGIALATLQQVTGINVFLYFGPEIFRGIAGAEMDVALLQTLVASPQLWSKHLLLWLTHQRQLAQSTAATLFSAFWLRS